MATLLDLHADSPHQRIRARFGSRGLTKDGLVNRRTTSRFARRSLVALGAAALAATALPASANAQVLDELGRPNEQVLGSVEGAIQNPAVPEDARATAQRLIDFFRGTGEPGVGIPENGPAISQFLYPTIMNNCIDGTSGAVGTITAVPGPANLPLPGVPEHQTGFVFTALGTGGAADEQAEPLVVDWVNPNNGRTGSTVLGYNGVNPDGPATMTGVADTGAGQVLAVLRGGLTTKIEGGVANCRVAYPTVGIIPVG